MNVFVSIVFWIYLYVLIFICFDLFLFLSGIIFVWDVDNVVSEIILGCYQES